MAFRRGDETEQATLGAMLVADFLVRDYRGG